MVGVNIDDRFNFDITKLRQLREQVNLLMTSNQAAEPCVMDMIALFPQILHSQSIAALQ